MMNISCVVARASEDATKDERGSEGPGQEHGGAFRDLSGMKFGKWSVLKWMRTDLHGSFYLCQCECGVQREVRGAALTNGMSRSCGGKGCRATKPKVGKTPAPEVSKEDSFIYRTWCELMEISEFENWRCQKDGEMYPVGSIAGPMRDWNLFLDWTRGRYAPELLPGKPVESLRQNYRPGMVLASKKVQISEQIGVAWGTMEWVYRQVAEGEERALIVIPEKTRYYHNGGDPDSPVMTRAELCEAYGMARSTMNVRLARGWTMAETCLGKRKILRG